MKIGVVGCGNVGSASAYACVLRGVGTDLVLVDHHFPLALAQAEDIAHATPFAKAMPVSAGAYDDLGNAGIVMIAAGVNQKPGETRLDLLKRNADIFADIIPRILRAAPDSILLVATNPVDIMTHIAARFAAEAGHPAGRVIGSGTILDTARFRTLLADHLGISSHSVHAHVVGEHGDSEVLHWSGANISNVGLSAFSDQVGASVTAEAKKAIDHAVRHAAYNIIQGKGATWYGIGAGMARLARAISENEHSVLTCCAPLERVEDIHDVTLSLPSVISACGLEKTIWPALDEGERVELRKSAEILRNALDMTGF